jgi:hypothetical protein
LEGLSLGVWSLDVAMVVVLLDLIFVVLEDGEDAVGEDAAVADFLLCKGGLVAVVVAVVLVFALPRTDGALTCRDSFAGRALGLALALGLLPADETTPPTCCFDCPGSGLVLRSFVPNSTPELSLSAFRRAGFFLGFLVALGSEGGWVVDLFATGLALPTLLDDEAGIVVMLADLRGFDTTMCVCVCRFSFLRPGQQREICILASQCNGRFSASGLGVVRRAYCGCSWEAYMSRLIYRRFAYDDNGAVRRMFSSISDALDSSCLVL